MIGGVVEQRIQSMGTLYDMRLRFVGSFTKFPPKARKTRQTNKITYMSGALNVQTLSAFYVFSLHTLSATYPYISF